MKTPIRQASLQLRLLAGLLAGLAASAARAEALPTPIDVYVSGQDGYHAFRIPALEVAPDGSLVAVAEARKYTSADPGMGKQEIDLVCKRSTDDGATWSPMAVIEHAGPLWAAANPATLVDRDTGKLWVFYMRAKPACSTESARPGTDDLATLARWSADSGKTWSGPVDLTAAARDMNDKTWRSSTTGPGGALQTRSGRLVVALWKMPFADLAMFSDDHGLTWRRGQFAPGTQGGDECKIIELADGRLLFDMRQETGPTRWFADSSDGGATWTHLRPGITVTPVACAIKRLTVGGRSWVLWTGPEGMSRKRLVIRTSGDEGLAFPHERLLTDGFAAYSDLVVLKDGSVGVMWERGVKKNYEFISFARLTPAWLASVLPGSATP